MNRFSSYSGGMTLPSLPLPLIGALILGWLVLRAALTGRQGPWFLALVALCAIQSAVIAGRFHYDLSILRPAQVLGAALIPSSSWMALQMAAVRRIRPADALHLWPLLAVLAGMVVWPMMIDAAIMAAFLGYGVAILWALRKGSDALPRTRLQGGDTAARLWRLIGAGLLLSASSEVLIITAFVTGHATWAGWIIGLYSAGSLVVIGGLSLSSDLAPTPGEQQAEPDPTQQENDAALIARLDALLTREALHRDPDLTLGRLARRLGVPAKTLSAAINRQTGENVSRLINARRIRDACASLSAGRTVTDAMLDAGFNTKSNFNREFRRVTGMTPSTWRPAQ
ncbi:MAG: helix-turn-helix domain-containing protein [Paracoccaceae bacterium]